MSQESHVQTYVKGMLNELVSTEYNDYLKLKFEKNSNLAICHAVFPQILNSTLHVILNNRLELVKVLCDQTAQISWLAK